MKTSEMEKKADRYLELLCGNFPDRSPGSENNRLAVRFFKEKIAEWNWMTREIEFDAVDWKTDGARLQCGSECYQVFPGPYSPGCDLTAQAITASTPEDLEKTDFEGKILILHGSLTGEQLMPKNFAFYNPPEHQLIISLLEKGNPAAIVSVTGKNASLAGGIYPFPLFEDGDFDIPSVYMTGEEGIRLLSRTRNQDVTLVSRSIRTQGKGSQLIARRGSGAAGRIVLAAHIDSKQGTPGAIDNATGVIVLLLLAELLQIYAGRVAIEIVPFNGEDYYAASGEMAYLRHNHGTFDDIILNITIDGAGYIVGETAFSLFNLSKRLHRLADRVMHDYPGIVEGPEYPQGDHSIFVQAGCPAIAVASEWLIDNLETQSITHTPADVPEIVDIRKVVTIAEALHDLVLAVCG